ncbi:MAG: divalent cation tolerance protein CutA, partial [Actinomycetota bacterium]
MTTDDEYGDLHVTCTDDGEAERIAAALVEHRLAACVQLTPVRSVFHWDDR